MASSQQSKYEKFLVEKWYFLGDEIFKWIEECMLAMKCEKEMQ